MTESLEVTAVPPHFLVNLRIPASDASVWTSVLGVGLPSVPNTLVPYGAGGWIAWLGPDEWLLASPLAVDAIEVDLRAAAGTVPVAIVDVSSSRTILQVSGTAARQLLVHGCALDLHPREFPAGRCAQTRLALANVLIAAPIERQSEFEAAPVYLVLVRASFARYLTGWLADAARGVTPALPHRCR